MQPPPPSVPFVEYVLKAVEHPPFMFVSKLAACCTMLFLTRSDPELLRTLCFKWAVRFQRDREKLISMIRRRSLVCRCDTEERNTSTDNHGTKANSENRNGSGEVDGSGLRLCNPDEAVEHLLRILNSLVSTYFSWNWHRTDYVIQVNKEYEAYVRENILPICVTTPTEEGMDDEEETPWLLSPSEYLSCPLLSAANFYGPLSRRDPRSSASQAGSEAPTMTTIAPGEGGRSHFSAESAGGLTAARSPKFATDEYPGGISATSTASSMMRGSDAGGLRKGYPSLPAVPLSFLTLANFREALKQNTDGLVIVFHAKYSAKSNEVLEAFQEIVFKQLLNPMPDIAVIYTVAEPELASLYNVSWLPTIVYTPPPTSAAAAATTGSARVDNAGGASPLALLPTPPTEQFAAADCASPLAESTRAWPLPTSTLRTLDKPASKDPMTAATGPGSTTSASANASALVVPECPSPTQVLYGLKVEKEAPRTSPSGSRLSPTSACTFLFSPTSSGALLVPTMGSATTVSNVNAAGNIGIAGHTGSICANLADSPSYRMPDNSLSCSSASMLTDSFAEELRTIVAADSHKVFPSNGVANVASLVEWISSGGQALPRVKRVIDSVTPVSTLRAEQKYKKFRELHSAVVMLRRLQSRGSKEDSVLTGGTAAAAGSGRTLRPSIAQNAATSSEAAAAPLANGICTTSEPPLFIFLGGGMAAGKSTAAMALAHSTWWRQHRGQSVLVNADEFKVTEPAFDGMQAEVHTRSTRAAESLLVQAINQGRSIVFDGTMMWAPFVVQVIKMVRDAHLNLYKQGPGYMGPSKPEQYFLKSEVRPSPLPHPYVIRFLGITVEPEIAVPRGFLRKFSTGRGVPITTQLRSFKLFAENFPEYAKLVDSATLYNNNVYVNLERGELPPVMAEKEVGSADGALRILDEPAYQLFMQQKLLNENADNVLELYPTLFSPPSPPARRCDVSTALSPS